MVIVHAEIRRRSVEQLGVFRSPSTDKILVAEKAERAPYVSDSMVVIDAEHLAGFRLALTDKARAPLLGYHRFVALQGYSVCLA